MKKTLLPMSKEASKALDDAHAAADRFVQDTIKELKKLPPLARAPAVVNLRGILNEVEITIEIPGGRKGKKPKVVPFG